MNEKREMLHLKMQNEKYDIFKCRRVLKSRKIIFLNMLLLLCNVVILGSKKLTIGLSENLFLDGLIVERIDAVQGFLQSNYFQDKSVSTRDVGAKYL